MGKGTIKRILSRTLNAAILPTCHCPQDTLDSAGGEVDFEIPSLGPTSVVNMFVTQVTDLGCPEPLLGSQSCVLQVSPAQGRGRTLQ